MILDRLLVSNRKRFCMETVPKTLYESSYPVVIFNKNEVEKFFEGDYKLIEMIFLVCRRRYIFRMGRRNPDYMFLSV